MTTTNKGTFAAVKFCNTTVDIIQTYLKEFKVPAPVKENRLHSTLLYSRKYLPGYQPANTYKNSIRGIPVCFHKWEIGGIVGGANQYALVLEYSCSEIVERHKQLMQEHQATFDYPEYIPHVTLSYDIGDLNIYTLPPIDKYLSELNIVGEYGEDIDLNKVQQTVDNRNKTRYTL